MKGLTIAIVLVIVYFAYRFWTSEHIQATGNTTPDDTKNVNIVNPQLTNGKIIQTDGPNANNFQLVPSSQQPNAIFRMFVPPTFTLTGGPINPPNINGEAMGIAPDAFTLNNPITPPNFIGEAMDNYIGDKTLLSNDNNISNVVNLRPDIVSPLLVASDIGQVPISVDGSRYGTNLPDPSLALKVPPTSMSLFKPLPVQARVTDNLLIMPMSLDSTSDVSIAARA